MVIQDKHQVGRIIDDKPMQLLGFDQLLLHGLAVFLQAMFLDRILQRGQQLLRRIGLLYVVIGALLENRTHCVKACIAADHDNQGIDTMAIDKIHDPVAIDPWHFEIE